MRMKRGKLFGLVGYSGAGKTTTTQQAIMLSDEVIRRVGFSDPFQMMLVPLGIDAELYNDKSKWNEPLPQLCGKTLRHATQTLGTEWGRNCISPELWVNVALTTVETYRRCGWTVIMDNVRFQTEFEAIEQAGGTLIAFHRPGLEPDLTHASEQHIATLQEWSHLRFEHREPFEESNRKFAQLIA